MKKSLILAVIGVSSAVACYGQGKIQFSNYYSSTQTTGVTYENGPAAGLGAATEMHAFLYYGPSGSTLVSQLSVVAGQGIGTALGFGYANSPGQIGTVYGAGWFGNPTLTVDAGNGGATYSFAIYVTGTYLGETYSGWSSIVDGVTQATSGSPVPTLPTALRQGSFTISAAPVPEPSTLALAGLGGFGMLMALRRKKA